MKYFILKILKWKLKILAQLTLRRYKPKIIGVTGTVGKTSTKEAVKTVLSYKWRTRSSSKSFNNELGLPLTILGDWTSSEGLLFWLKVLISAFLRLIFKKADYPEILILEYGVDRPGDMKYLLTIARPIVGIFTALSEVPAHVEFFTGPEGVAREKVKLFNQLPATGFAVLNADDAAIREVKNQTRAQSVSFGFSEFADIKINNFINHFDGGIIEETFKLSYGGSFVPIRLKNILGRAQAYAAAAAAATV